MHVVSRPLICCYCLSRWYQIWWCCTTSGWKFYKWYQNWCGVWKAYDLRLIAIGVGTRRLINTLNKNQILWIIDLWVSLYFGF